MLRFLKYMYFSQQPSFSNEVFYHNTFHQQNGNVNKLPIMDAYWMEGMKSFLEGDVLSNLENIRKTKICLVNDPIEIHYRLNHN